MALKVPPELRAKWEKVLASEGLAPLTTYSADAVKQRRLVRRLKTGGLEQTERHYQRAQKALRRIELAHAVWSLYCEGMGRPAISQSLAVPEKVVRLVLHQLFDIFDL